MVYFGTGRKIYVTVYDLLARGSSQALISMRISLNANEGIKCLCVKRNVRNSKL